ncbi:hypothetical protein CARUB_v10011356mg [Capsella rubella]|uniref:Auxin-responsive GH3 family protein n=1 Tax=Capsella rubella TaxID=81985 RepID=R0GNB3_9BRAS|nr:hypothetical protein CARUB_v10011356mg [Capsella rubella]
MGTSYELKDLEDLTLNAKQIQDEVLKEILTLDANTEYLQRFLHGSSDKDFFKKNVPIVSYDDVKPYIERVANGEPSDVISGGTITRFLRRHLKDNDAEKGKKMMFLYNRPESTTPSGLLVALASTSLVKSHYFSNRPSKCNSEYTSPDQVILCPDNNQSVYCHLLCGLSRRDEVVGVACPFAYALVHAIDVLQSYWEELSSNIRTGHVSKWITDLNCRNSSWEGILTRLWPKAKYIECIITGQMAQYIPTLDFYSNKLPIVSPLYGSSESLFGLNMDPLCKPQDVSYTFVPNISYFEFLPVDHKGDIVDLVDVKLGCYYEPVVTNYFGLHRLLVGDILQVTGYYNSTPQFRFVRRKNMVLSVEIETTTEEDLLKASARATLVLDQSTNLMLTGFTCYADISTFPGHYVFYWELKAKDVNDVVELDENVLAECCFALEESFDALYRKLRSQDGLIGALEIRVVQQGTFDSLMEYFISQGGSIAQYKTPLCIKSSEALALLENKVLARFHSKKSPPLDL